MPVSELMAMQVAATNQEIRIKSRVSCHLISVRVAITQNREVMSVGEGVKESEPLHTLTGNVDWCSHCEKHMEVPQKIKSSFFCCHD